jgi:transglutaminase-like putative cysteine protease
MQAMTHAIKHEFRYGARYEEGTQTAAQTIELGAGTCRYFAVLMIEALRSFGLATRLVTGYLYDEISSTTREVAAPTPGAAFIRRAPAGLSTTRPTG